MKSSRLSQWCDGLLEAGWLLGGIITPVFFNVFSDRVFEPDKLTTLRALTVFMAIVWLVRFVELVALGEKPLRFSWRTPLVLPALLTMALYLISSLFSLVPYTSFIGSYQRLQGTFTLSAYLVLFFSIVTVLKTRTQLQRLLTTLILASLPVGLYGIVQHLGGDPLPWGGDVRTRVASNMGNSIFVGAYLIIIVPLTLAKLIESFRAIMQRNKARLTDVLRASGYLFILGVQLLTIWFSQSRGPWLGIIAALFLFIYLALLALSQQAQGDAGSRWPKTLAQSVGFSLASLLLLALAGGLGYGLVHLLKLSVSSSGLAVVLGTLAFGTLWLYAIVERPGSWRWLWISWGTIGLILAALLLAMNLPGPIKTRVLQSEQFRRLAEITEVESGTGKVRTLIWQGTVKLIAPHAPITYPDGHQDPFNVLRPLIGYGPESMYVAYNRFYPAELGHYESRTASPDRSHNETLDSLVNAGVLGLGVYLFTFLSVFGWGLHWLGLLHNRRDLMHYLGLAGLFILAFTLIGWQASGLYLFAVSVPLGILAGSTLYVTWKGFQHLARPAAAPLHPHTLLIVAILAGVFAHFIEINFGIAIASTRTVFWSLSGLLVVLGLNWITDELPASVSPQVTPAFQTARKGHKKRPAPAPRPAPATPAPTTFWLAPTLALSLILVFLIGTLSFDFINNPDRLSNVGEIFWRAFTWIYIQSRTSYGGLVIVLFPMFLGALVGLSELDNEGRFGQHGLTRWAIALGLVLVIAFTGWFLYGNTLAARQAALSNSPIASVLDIVALGKRLSSTLGLYYGLMYLIWLSLGWVLSFEAPERPKRLASSPALLVLAVGAVSGVLIVQSGSYNLIRADILFKQGKVYAEQRDVNQHIVGIAHYEAALDLAPREDYYYLFLGKASLELAQSHPDAATQSSLYQRTEAILKKALTLNPLNTDHSANLARFYRAWAAVTSDAAQRNERLALSESYYRQALALSPSNPILWNELAILKGFDMRDEAAFQEIVAQSLKVDEGFEQTWMLLGDWYAGKENYPAAIETYEKALKVRRNCTVYYVLGSLYAQQTQWLTATQRLEEGIRACSTYENLWDMYRLQAIAYSNLGMKGEALAAIAQAIQLAPLDKQSSLEQLRSSLEAMP